MSRGTICADSRLNRIGTIARSATKTLAVVVTVAASFLAVSSGARANTYGFTNVSELSSLTSPFIPLAVTSVTSGYTSGVYMTPFPDAPTYTSGEPQVTSFLDTYFGLTLGTRLGGACGANAIVANGCSGGTTQTGHSNLTGSLFAVHIGGQEGAFLAFLYPSQITGFDITFDANGNDITGLSSIWAYDSVSQAPIPGALLLFGSGLAVLGFCGHRRNRDRISTT